jgi:hypothetical protein
MTQPPNTQQSELGRGRNLCLNQPEIARAEDAYSLGYCCGDHDLGGARHHLHPLVPLDARLGDHHGRGRDRAGGRLFAHPALQDRQIPQMLSRGAQPGAEELRAAVRAYVLSHVGQLRRLHVRHGRNQPAVHHTFVGVADRAVPAQIVYLHDSVRNSESNVACQQLLSERCHSPDKIVSTSEHNGGTMAAHPRRKSWGANNGNDHSFSRRGSCARLNFANEKILNPHFTTGGVAQALSKAHGYAALAFEDQR